MKLITRVLLLTVITVLGWKYLVMYSERLDDEMQTCRVSQVHDGGAVVLTCGEGEKIAAQLSGLDMPKAESAGCEAEMAHGALATDRLRALIEGGEVSLRQTGLDQDGTSLVRIFIDGEDLADQLIREGLAVPVRTGAQTTWCDLLRATE